MGEIITIEKVEEATSARGPYKTMTYGGGKKASCFDGSLLSLLTLGKTLEVEIEAKTRGDKTYHNITAAKPSEKPAEKPMPAPSRGREPGERQSIERQTALKAAVELVGYAIAKGKDFGSREVIQAAAEFAAFLNTGKVPGSPPQTPAVAPGSPPEALKAAAGNGTSPKPKPGGAIGPNTIGAVRYWAKQKGVDEEALAQKQGAKGVLELTEAQGQEILRELKA